MNSEMGGDEVFLLCFSLVLFIITVIRWASALRVAGRFRFRGWPLLFITPMAGLGVVYFVLRRWADDEVQNDWRYITLLLLLGGAWMGIVSNILHWWGLSLREDAAERRNPAAATAWCGTMLGAIALYSGGNTGEGLSLWNNVFSALIPVANAGIAVVSESKRFPLVWPELQCNLSAWKRLLPETRDPREVNWHKDDLWVLKTAMCNTGDDVIMRSALDQRRWRKIARAVRWSPGAWFAQRRFETQPIETRRGPMFPCIGVYTLNGRACGAYARLSRTPIVNYSAVDVPLLIQDEL